MKLADLQQEFFNAIVGAEHHFDDCVVEHGDINKGQRISIYQNAYFTRLKETLESDHEILGFYLGDDLFDQMATGYVKAYPSPYRSLRFYAENLPEFLKQHEPFSDYPLISELARFERLLMHAFDAAEASRATLQQLQAIKPNDWPYMQFRLHPSCQLFVTNTNCVEVWQALKMEQSPPDARIGNAYWLIWRNEERLTEFISLNTIEISVAQQLLQGHNFSDICEMLSELMNEEDVSQFAVTLFIAWLNKGIISRIDKPE